MKIYSEQLQAEGPRVFWVTFCQGVEIHRSEVTPHLAASAADAIDKRVGTMCFLRRGAPETGRVLMSRTMEAGQ